MAPELRIREATLNDIPAIAAVHVTSWDENYRGLLDDAMFDARPVEVRIGHWEDSFRQPNRFTFVAEDGGQVVGFASTQLLSPPLQGFDSYLQTLYLIVNAKRRGIGRALLKATADAAIRRGCRNMALRVLRLNPARAFYERLGARLVPEGFPIDADEFDDVVYAFDDLRELV